MLMRIRTIKPDFFLHVRLFEAEVETGLPMRVAFAGLWCAADREGRFKWEPLKLKVQILPYDQVDFSRVLDALTTRGFVVRYASKFGDLGCIPSFPRHQVINNRERPSELPPPPQNQENQELDACPTRAPRVDDACPTEIHSRTVEGKGREGKGIAGDREPRAREEVNPQPQYAEANRPAWEEVWAFAQRIGLSEWKARDWLDEMLSIGWRDWQHRPVVNWQPMLTRVCRKWEGDGRPTTPPVAAKSQANGSPGKPMSVLDLKTVIGLKEEKCSRLKMKNYNEGPLGGEWTSKPACEEFKGLRAEIRKLKEEIERKAA